MAWATPPRHGSPWPGSTAAASIPSRRASDSKHRGVETFTRAGITVEWMDYAGYLPYPQLYGAFEPAVSVLDLLFSVGPDAPRYVRPGSSAAAPILLR